MSSLQAQTQVDLRTQSKSVDFSAASRTLPFQAGSTVPATCRVGEAFFKTDAEAGKNLLLCTAPDSWTALSADSLADLVPTASGNVLSVSAGKARIGNRTYHIGPGTLAFSAGSGDCKVFVSEQGVPTTQCAAGIAGSAGGSMTFGNVGTPGFPAGSIPLADVTLSNGIPALDSDLRAVISTKALAAGPGVSVTDSEGIAILATDSTQIPTFSGANRFTGENDFSGAARFRARSGGGLPAATDCDEAGEVGGIFVRDDAAAPNASLYVCAKSGTSTYGWELAQATPGGGSGSSELDGHFVPSAAGNVLSIAAGEARIGNQMYAIAPGSVTFSAGTGSCKVFVSEQGILSAHCGPGITGVPGGSMVLAGVTTPAFPAGSIPLADATLSNGTPSVLSDLRAFLSTKALQPGAGIAITEAGGVASIAADTTTIPTLAGANAFTGESDFSAAAKLRLRTGAGVPAGVTCDEAVEVGGVYVRSDAQAVNASLYVCSRTGSSSYAWELAQGSGGGGGDISSNTSTSVDGELAVFSGTSGKTIARAAGSGVARIANGVLGTVPGNAGDCVKVDGTSGACGTGGGFDPFARNTLQWVDEFATGLATNGNIGALGWTVSNNNGTTSVTAQASEANHPGIVRVKTGAANMNDAAISLRNSSGTNDLIRLDQAGGWEFQWIVKPVQLTDCGLAIGLGTTGLSTWGNSLRIKFDTNDSDTTWMFQACSNATCTTQASTVTPIAGTWYRMRIRSTAAGTVLYSVDGEPEVSISSNLPAVAVTPGVSVKTRTAAESSIDLDWFAGQATVTR